MKWWRSDADEFLSLSLIAIWAVAMGGWWILVSKYFQSADLDRFKTRLLGTKAARPRARRAAARASVMQQDAESKNRLAQKIVDKYPAGPEDSQELARAGRD